MKRSMITIMVLMVALFATLTPAAASDYTALEEVVQEYLKEQEELRTKEQVEEQIKVQHRDTIYFGREVEHIERIDFRSKESAFIYRGEMMFGLTASHNSLSTDNAEYLTLLTNMSIEGNITTIKPFAGYFYRDNKAVGARFGYVSYGGTIDSSTLDLGETNDLSFDVPYVSLSSTNYSYSIFHRTYAPLDKKGHFGAYAEIEMSASNGESTFAYDNDGEIRSSYSKNQSYSLSFNPGISAFMLHNVCASFSFEFGGLNYTNIRQYNEAGEQIGSRDSSKMKFMFNVFAVNFGITVHIW